MMDYTHLGNTELKVSRLCLGTMTFGEQNTESEAHAQLNLAIEHGINFIDTAEMYPVPPRSQTQGLTETYIGSWLKRNPERRDQLVIASKAAGPVDEGMDYIRGGPQLDLKQITQAIEDSLRRLNCDYIDLYQVHWPARKTNYFGKLGYIHDDDADATPIEVTLAALNTLVESGLVRHIGISNETPWGVMRYLQLAEQHGWPRIVSIQNPYNLLNRSFEVGLSEIAHREQVGLLAYSPLAFGVLSGKYLDGQRPTGARLTLFDRFDRYTKPPGIHATEHYCAIAKRYGLDPAQMALAYVNSRPFLTSNIIGATTLQQLKANIESMDLQLGDEVLEEIEAVHQQHSNPCP